MTHARRIFSRSLRSRTLAIPALLAAVALAPAGCDPDEGRIATEVDEGDAAFIAPAGELERRDELASSREAIRLQEEAYAQDPEHDDLDLQAELAERMIRALPEKAPVFATTSARTELAELSGDQILSRLGYAPGSAYSVEGDKDVYDDGVLRLRVSRTVPGYVKFADRGLLRAARDSINTVAPASEEVIERNAARVLDELGVPSSERTTLRAHAVKLDTGNRDGKTIDHGTAAYVVSVQRQLDRLPVLGSACTLAFDTSGYLTWARCRWPQFRLAAGEPAAEGRPSSDVAARMALQLDRSMGPGSRASDFEINAGYAYAERVTSTGVEYVPVLRVIMSAAAGGGAGDFLETVSGSSL